MLTVKAVAERLACSSATVYSLISGGKLRCLRVGLGRGAIRISEEHLAEYLQKAEINSPSPAPPPPRRPVWLKYLHQD